MTHDEPNNQTWQFLLSDADQQLIDRIRQKIADGKTVTLMQEQWGHLLLLGLQCYNACRLRRP
jgi:hypothetical protein